MNEEKKYPPSGALFTVDEAKRKHEKSPNYQGDFELSREVVEDLYRQIQNPAVDGAKFHMVGWKRTSKRGTLYLSLLGNVFEEQEKKSPF
jgi:hypothetical protein|tara:strand:+ start:783 stop:1052 length:270 start_codon:yes stop_codon:yes gene_type:complete